MKIILTGPNSFSGKTVLRTLLSQGHQVTTLSRSVLPVDIAKLVTPIYGDLSNINSLSGDFDAVVHIAATSPISGKSCTDFINDNILATANLIKLAAQANVSKFIFFSTLSVYGEILEELVTENTPINNPCTYGASKLMCEAMLREQESFKSIAIRLPAVIGKDAARHWLANTIHKFKNDQEITIFNPQAKFNNAIHIQNLAKFVAILLEQNFPKHFDYVNVASMGGLDIETIAQKIKQKFASKSMINVAMVQRKSFMISTEHAVKNYGFKPLDFVFALEDYLNESEV